MRGGVSEAQAVAIETQRTVARVGFEEGVVAISEVADLFGQSSVAAPKPGVASQGFGSTCPVVALRLADQRIECAGRGVGVDLAIPHCRVVFGKPLPKSREVFLRRRFTAPVMSATVVMETRLLR